MTMGYLRRDIEESLAENKYDSLTATYLLLGRPTLDVSEPRSISRSYRDLLSFFSSVWDST